MKVLIGSPDAGVLPSGTALDASPNELAASAPLGDEAGPGAVRGSEVPAGPVVRTDGAWCVSAETAVAEAVAPEAAALEATGPEAAAPEAAAPETAGPEAAAPGAAADSDAAERWTSGCCAA
ncbi:hypothetical protein [Occultella kanbiaonis]|uniref:hypothetical protein n=1 Tax=Occultella kanbiaonis TaxID=2675754 RepID=UPI0013D38486|nr:hypothetical protein [Occultella kanbiaonis]